MNLVKDGKIPEEQVEPLPWPLTMAQYLYSTFDGTFPTHPWPNRDWTYNMLALSAMKICHRMDKLMHKNPLEWDKDDDKFWQAVIVESDEWYETNECISIKIQSKHNN